MAGRYPDVKKDDAISNVVSLPGVDLGSISNEEAQAKSAGYRPRGLSKDQRKVWDRVVPEFILEGRFKAIYIEFFKNYCVVVARMEKALNYLEMHDWKYVTVGRNGEQHKTRPEAAQYNDDWRKWNSMVNQIGMSPATDQRFHNLQPDLFNDPYGE
jgi:P27 family predicted phage terminase small subunit